MGTQDIKSADWSLAVGDFGQVVEGVQDINQCIVTILSTNKGSDPFRPNFGSDIWDWIDRPLPVALPNMKLAIYEAIGLWEQRVHVTGIQHAYQNEAGIQSPVQAGIQFKIGWRLRGTQTTGTAEIILGLYDQSIKNAQQVVPMPGVQYLSTEAGEPITTETSENITV